MEHITNKVFKCLKKTLFVIIMFEMFHVINKFKNASEGKPRLGLYKHLLLWLRKELGIHQQTFQSGV